MDYTANAKEFLKIGYEIGLFSHAFAGPPPIVSALNSIFKSGKEIRSAYEMDLILTATQSTGGIYYDWLMGYWKPDEDLTWWSSGVITRCDHKGKRWAGKICKCIPIEIKKEF